MDLLYSHIGIKLIRWIDPIKKNEFEKLIVLFNFFFMTINHFVIIILLRIYQVARFGQCMVKVSSSDLTLEFLKHQDGFFQLTGELPANKQVYYDSQNIALGCIQEIRSFFTMYIILNFLLILLRMIIMKVKVRRTKKEIQNRIEELENYNGEKFDLWKQTKGQFLQSHHSLSETSSESDSQEANNVKQEDSLMVDNLMKDISTIRLINEETTEVNNDVADGDGDGEYNRLDTEEHVNKKNVEINFEENKLKPNQNSKQEERTDRSMTRNMSTKSKKKQNKHEEIKAFKQDMFKSYYRLNHYIETEVYLQNFAHTSEVDPTIDNLNHIFSLYLALILFGFLFELSYLFYYFAIIIEVYIDKEEFIYISRRPTPQELNSIGYFKYFLEMTPKFSMLIISYYLSFYVIRVTLDINMIYTLFILVFANGILFKKLIEAIPPKGSEKMRHLIVRQKHLENKMRLIDQFFSNSKDIVYNPMNKKIMPEGFKIKKKNEDMDDY